MTDAVTVRNLVKTYGSARAVDDISLTVKLGTIFGLLGPNGAGKTTTLECIEGLRRPDSGEISVLGIDPSQHRRRLYRTIGVQLQTSSIRGNMTALEALHFFGKYQGITPDTAILERLGMGEHLHKPYGSMSVGQKRRLTLAISASHAPKVLFLDEPTAGLDVESRIELHSLIREFKAEGRTVIIATHDMAEAETLCDEIAIIIRGKLAVLGTPSQVTSAGDKRTRIQVSTDQGSICKAPPELPEAVLISAENGYVCYSTESPQLSLKALMEIITMHGDEITDLRVERPSLEQRFIEITKNKGDAA